MNEVGAQASWVQKARSGSKMSNRLGVCRDLQLTLKSEKSKVPKQPAETRRRFKTHSPRICHYKAGKNQSSNRKHAFRRRLWHYFKKAVLLKRRQASSAQEARAGRVTGRNPQARQQFKEYYTALSRKIRGPFKCHKAKGFKLPYQMPMKFASVNVRGLMSENGITKWQLIVDTMKKERYDVMLLSETQVNSSSLETHDDYLFFFSSDVLPDKKDREHAGVGIVLHKKLRPCVYEVRQISSR